MQILGLYTPLLNGSMRLGSILKTLKELHNAQPFLPIVITLEHYISIIHHVGFFPLFYSVDRSATIHQLLAQSFFKDQSKFGKNKADNISQLSFYLFDSSDIPSIYGFAKDIALISPQICWLNLWFEGRCEIVSLLFLTVDE